jgi:NADH:ubiquinone oxidoreductase subunit 6 (subunit J)
MPVKKAPSNEFRNVKIFHLFADGSIKKPSTYIAVPSTNKIIKSDKNSFRIVQSLLFEKYLIVFRILTARYMKIPDKKL